MTEFGQYLYAITDPLADEDLTDVHGLGDAPLRAVEHDGLAAVVGTVDLGEFGEDALPTHLEDLDWLKSVARMHHNVVCALADRVPTAPLRLGTIVLDDAGIRDRLTHWAPALRGALGQISGRAEWSVKVFAGSAVEAESTSETGMPQPSGKAYLARRKAQAAQRTEAAEQAAAVAEEIHTELTRYSAATRRLALQDSRLTGEEATMTLNAAYLVDSSGAAEFCAAAEELGRLHFRERVDVAGPWPAYSFVEVGQQ